MPFNLRVPAIGGDHLALPANVGQVCFLLGPNGVGKSSLMQFLSTLNRGHSRRVVAHRQIWFDSATPNLALQNKVEIENSVRNQEADPSSRWRDAYGPNRAGMTLMDLIDAENRRAREIANAVDGDQENAARILAHEHEAPLKVINELLREANIPVAISLGNNSAIMAVKEGGLPYSSAQLSDGERNALLMAADVLTAPAGTLILIDEPERHLHRAISSPLLSLLFARRPDCGFIVSTHDIELALDHRSASTVLVRGCEFQDEVATSWQTDLLGPDAEIDDDLKRSVLGARRKLIFVEGTVGSLDKPLYHLLFPEASVVAGGSCRDVEQSVAGLRGAAGLNWIRPFGIVDNDRRPTHQIDRLAGAGVFALPVYSVESIYYHPEVSRKVLARQTAVTGENPGQMLTAARAAALAAIPEHIDRLAAVVVEKRVRAQIFASLPTRGTILDSDVINIQVDTPQIVREERRHLTALLADDDLDSIIAYYPIRSTGALGALATRLGFQSRAQYESAVCKLLVDDEGARQEVRQMFGPLNAALVDA